MGEAPPADPRGDAPSKRSAGGDGKLADRLCAEISSRIHDGSFQPATRLPSEAALARGFAVSRPVVREALARLRDRGLIVSRQGSGSWVRARAGADAPQFAPVGSIADVLRCFEFRLTFEGRAAALAARRHDAAALARIEAAWAALERASLDARPAEDPDFRFHRAITEAAGNHFFASTLAMLEDQFRTAQELARSLRGPDPEAPLTLVRAEHRRVLEAIRARDAAGAEQAMVEHIDRARRRLLEGEDQSSARTGAPLPEGDGSGAEPA